MFAFPFAQDAHHVGGHIVWLFAFNNASHIVECEADEVMEDVIAKALDQFAQVVDGEVWAPGHIGIDEVIDGVGTIVRLSLLFAHFRVLQGEEHFDGDAASLTRREDRFVVEAEVYVARPGE